MIDFTNVSFEGIAIHNVGNKVRDEGIKIANKDIFFEDDETTSYLLRYFLMPFNDNEVYNFCHPSDLSLNEIYTYAKRIFDTPQNLYNISIDIAKHLYEKSTHPKIDGGEFCICYFKDCVFNNETVDAIGLFKSEEKDDFLKFDGKKNNYTIKHENGINVNKLDKGCMIFNSSEDSGFQLCITGGNKSSDTQYWKNDFLNIKPASDNYHHTKDFLSVTREYLTKQLSEEFEVSKADKIDLLNRSVAYFKANEKFEKNDFENEVIQDKKMIKSFRTFNETYSAENDLEIADSFDISSQALKKQARIFKSVLKLDKNFHIYIHGDRELIEQGMDKDGRKFYKIYFKEES
nr:nucleoid-associated protein [Bacteroidota bacterium]